MVFRTVCYQTSTGQAQVPPTAPRYSNSPQVAPPVRRESNSWSWSCVFEKKQSTDHLWTFMICLINLEIYLRFLKHLHVENCWTMPQCRLPRIESGVGYAIDEGENSALHSVLTAVFLRESTAHLVVSNLKTCFYVWRLFCPNWLNWSKLGQTNMKHIYYDMSSHTSNHKT